MTIFEVLAHEGEEAVGVIKPALDEVIRTNSLKFSLIAGGLLLGVAFLALIFKSASDRVKYLLFGAIVIVATSLWCFAFFSIYMRQDVRVAASNWLESNISSGTLIKFLKLAGLYTIMLILKFIIAIRKWRLKILRVFLIKLELR